MRTVLALALVFSAASAAAWAGDMDRTDRIDGHRHGRAFWLDNQAWPSPAAAKPANPRFTLTYTDGLAQRFGVGNGHTDLFSSTLDGSDEPGVPTLQGTVDGGGPKLVLRWHPDE